MDRTPLQALPIDDEDANYLLRDVEDSFEIEFGADAAHCCTAGDLLKAVLTRLPAGNDKPLCATSMAFYRARSALGVLYGVDRRAGPAWRLSNLAPRHPKSVFKAIARDLALRPPSPPPSAWGVAGSMAMVLALPCLILSAIVPVIGGWPPMAMLVLGSAAFYLDPGSYGKMTLGDLARKLARENFGRLADAGADTRPEAVWRTLTEMMGLEADCEPHRIAPETWLWRTNPSHTG
jgi:hypothetical protein